MGKSVRVVPYDPSWPERFAEETRLLHTILPDVAIHHIGSTSVPGLPAKPVLDLLVEARALRDLDDATPALRAAGYDARGAYGIPGRRYFVRRPEGAPAIHVHGFVDGHEHAMRHLRVRDFLRDDEPAAAEYGALKRSLASRHRDDREAYQAGKEALIEDILRRAPRRAPGREATPAEGGGA